MMIEQGYVVRHADMSLGRAEAVLARWPGYRLQLQVSESGGGTLVRVSALSGSQPIPLCAGPVAGGVTKQIRRVTVTLAVAKQWRWMKGAALAVGLGLASGEVWAHPHGWIDLSMRVITNEAGEATGVHQTWRMDPFYSLVVFEELQQVPGASLEEGLDQLGSDIRNNLVPQHYFTELRINRQRQAFGEVTEYTAMERDGRLTFMFILPWRALSRCKATCWSTRSLTLPITSKWCMKPITMAPARGAGVEW